MATGWIRAIRAVPWNEVIAAAPMVVGSAKKILSALQKKERAERAAARAEPTPPPDDPELKALHERLAGLEADLVRATEVLEHLADQHAQLVVALEALRQRTRALLWTSAGLAAAVIGFVLWLVLR